VPDVLILADTIRSPELRHEVPLVVPDEFLYVERNGTRHVVAPSLELGRVAEAMPNSERHPYEEFGVDELARSKGSIDDVYLEIWVRACQSLGVEEASVPVGFPLQAADHLRAHGVEIAVDRGLFEARRRVKSEPELEGIRRAQRAAEAGLRAGLDVLRRAEPKNGGLVVDGEPLTSELVKIHVERAFGEHGASSEDFIVSHGAQTAVGHEMGRGPIAPGEIVLFDLFPRDRESGCFADMTRTFVLGGEPSDEIREYHRLSREALERIVAAVRPGVNGKEIHRLVCDFFHEHGYPTQLHKRDGEVLESGFFHGTGHGVGLEVHEKPNIGRTGEDFVAGDVIAVEPGLYRAGYGGVRLEDIVVVTEDGAEVLTDFPYELEIDAA
jgi:Xaa-Pro aminopeptidase